MLGIDWNAELGTPTTMAALISVVATSFLAIVALTVRPQTRVYMSAAATDLEADVLRLAAASAPARDIEAAVAKLVAAGGGEAAPALSPRIEGEWKLVHITSSGFDPRNPLGRRVDGSSPGIEGFVAALTGGLSVTTASSSPIQRAVTAAFSVSQSIYRPLEPTGRVEQLVRTPLGELHLNAAASVDRAQPQRIKFAFDEGYFELTGSGLHVPYPVPFRLLGKEAEGFLDTSYLGEQVRVSTGNKGTTFVLERVV